MRREFFSLVPGQRAQQVREPISAQAGQQHVAGLALDQRRDKRPAGLADEQVALPMARDAGDWRPVRRLAVSCRRSSPRACPYGER
jgi:hypothetical protein